MYASESSIIYISVSWITCNFTINLILHWELTLSVWVREMEEQSILSTDSEEEKV